MERWECREETVRKAEGPMLGTSVKEKVVSRAQYISTSAISYRNELKDENAKDMLYQFCLELD